MSITKYSIREKNEATVLEKIIEYGPVSRAEIATITGLTRASMTSIIKKLINECLAEEVGVGESSATGGPKPILLEFNTKVAVAIGIDIGLDTIEGMVSYIDGSCIAYTIEENVAIKKEDIIERLIKMIRYLSSLSPETPRGIVGITIGVQGAVLENRISVTPHSNLSNVDFKTELESIFNIPTVVQNGSNLAALAEYLFSENSASIVALTIYNGIGSGIVENGILQIGESGYAGEIGHSIIVPNGRKCFCGNKGCLEMYASEDALLKEARALKRLNSEYSLEFLVSDYNDKDKMIVELINEWVLYLSIGINNAIVSNNPQLIIINSRLIDLLPKLLELLQNNLKSQYSLHTKLKKSSIGKHAVLYGAIGVGVQNFLNIDKLKFFNIAKN